MKRDLTAAQLAQEVTVTLPLSAILGLGAPQIEGREEPIKIAIARALPAIGEKFEDGIYAGITVHDNDPHELVLLPGEFKGTWEKAKAWATEQGGVLPSRIDQLVLFKNLKSEFKDDWYWSGEQFAGDDACAWVQDFSYGYQDYGHKDGIFRCRAVRRVPIQ